MYCRSLLRPTTHRSRNRESRSGARSGYSATSQLCIEIVRVWNQNQQVYGAKKVWKQLNREGIRVGRCRVERLMLQLGLTGAVRGRRFKLTTIPDGAAARPLDLVERNFTAERPNQLWVSDLTYVARWRGFVYVAFVIDVCSPLIVGWRVSTIAEE